MGEYPFKLTNDDVGGGVGGGGGGGNLERIFKRFSVISPKNQEVTASGGGVLPCCDTNTSLRT